MLAKMQPEQCLLKARLRLEVASEQTKPMRKPDRPEEPLCQSPVQPNVISTSFPSAIAVTW
jgi:hypothetical protein